MAELAGLSKGAAYEIREIVPKVVDELAIKVSTLPEAIFRKAGHPARAFLAGDLEFLTAAREVTDLLFGTACWDFAERPDVELDSFGDITLFNEWVYTVDNGFEDDGWYFFKSRSDAEACFRAVAAALTNSA
ncbi:hypothetical protein ACFFXY_20925 [Glycomyces mayteni]|uniref:hypothetical protein n=1 Tax=Glycomyces mayteni TaxID=543887 RepID=UPI0035EC716E